MRRMIQCSVVILLSACTPFALAAGYDYTKEDLSGYNLQPTFEVTSKQTESTDFSRNGKAVYFFGGYVYTERFLKNTSKDIYNPIDNTTYSYSPKSLFSSSFSGLNIGVGKEVSRYIDFEASYIQQFEQSKSGTTISPAASTSTTVKMNGMLGDMGIVFNPDDRFQVIGKLGVLLAQFTTTASIANSASFTFSDNTKVDPAAGLEFLMQFNRHIGMRLDTLYVADTQSSNSNGEIDAILGLNYIL